jgi:hypothetical protein
VQKTSSKNSKAALPKPLPIASLEILFHVFHQLSEAVNQALTNLRANYTHQSNHSTQTQGTAASKAMRRSGSSQPTETVTSDTILDLHCEKTRKSRARPTHSTPHHKKLMNDLSRAKHWKKHALRWRNHLLKLLRLQHNEAHERPTQGPLVLAILKHDTFQQLQHNSWQCAEKR